MARASLRSTVAVEVNANMIGIVGTLVLLPLAIVGLLIGFMRFGLKLIAAVAAATIARVPHTG
jgi:hypothetical protein